MNHVGIVVEEPSPTSGETLTVDFIELVSNGPGTTGGSIAKTSQTAGFDVETWLKTATKITQHRKYSVTNS